MGLLGRHSSEEAASPEPSGAARVTALRLLTWAGVVSIAFVSFRDTSPWAWCVPLCVAAYVGLRAALAERLPAGRVVMAVDLALPLVGSTLLISLTGGWSSPFAALYFLNIAEGVAAKGAAGGVGVAIGAAVLGLVHLRAGVGLQAALALGFAAGLLVLSALLLQLAGTGQQPSRTILKERTVEELDRQLQELGEQHHRLRGTHHDLAAAFREQRERLQEVHAGQAILAASVDADDEAALYERVLQAIARAQDARGAVLWLVDPTGTMLRVRAHWGTVAPVVAESPIPCFTGMQAGDARKACEERLRLSAPGKRGRRAEARAAHADVAELVSADRRDVAGLALREGEELIGVVALCGAEGGGFTDDQVASLNEMRETVALALRNVAERTRLRQGVREVGLLHDLAGIARAAADLDAACERALHVARRYIAFENATLFLLDSRAGRLLPAATVGQAVNLIDHVAFEAGNGLSGWVAQKRKVLAIPDVLEEPGLLNAELIPPDVRSFVAVPLMIQDRVLGVLNLSHSNPRAFSAEDTRLAAAVAGQVALAVIDADAKSRDETAAIADPLTGVLTHRHFRQRFEEELRRAERYGLSAALLLLDIDRMEQLNLRFGTAGGDQLLGHVGRSVRANVRAADIVGREGGDEFAVLLTQTSWVDGVHTAKRLGEMVASTDLVTPDGRSMRATASVVVVAYPEDGATVDEMLARAGQAVADVKAHGGNDVRRA